MIIKYSKRYRLARIKTLHHKCYANAKIPGIVEKTAQKLLISNRFPLNLPHDKREFYF
jgi:hypothetical protein